MIPIGGIIAAVAIAARVASRNANGGASGGGGVRAPPPVSRGSVRTSADGVAILTWVFCGAGALGLPSAILSHNPWAIGLCSVCFVFTFPWWVARKVLAPLGLHRLAFYVANFSRNTWLNDKPGGPAFAAALALAHQDNASPRAIQWVEQKLNQSGKCLQPSGVGALALLEAAKGQYDSARALFDSLLQFDKRLLPRTLRLHAGQWLASDAAARGDWEKVLQVANHPQLPYSRLVALLAASARRALSRPDAPGRFGLWLAWLWAPRRLWTFLFVRKVSARALRPARPSGSPALAPLPSEAGPVAAALHRHLSLRLESGKLSGAALKSVAAEWEKVLEAPGTLLALADRCAALGGGEVNQTLAKVRELLEAELAALAERAEGGAGGETPALLKGGLSQRRDQLFDRFEQLMDQMDRRKQAKRELDAPSEWREVVALRGLYSELVAGVELPERQLVFSVVRDRLVNYAVWLYNERSERPIANAVFRFLWTEATAMGDESSAKLNQKNADCTL